MNRLAIHELLRILSELHIKSPQNVTHHLLDILPCDPQSLPYPRSVGKSGIADVSGSADDDEVINPQVGDTAML